MEKGIKLLYETSVKKQIEEPTIEKKLENGEEIEIKRIVKKAKPIKLAILKPDRRLLKAGEMFYAKTLSEYLKAGLMPFSLVAKRYANDGGVLTDSERNRIAVLKEEAKTLESEFYADKNYENEEIKKKTRNEILVRLNSINMEVNNISNAYSDIYDTTAEVKARNDTMEWWGLFLFYADLDGKGYKPFFSGETYEEKIKSLEEIENKEDAFEKESMNKISFLVSFWVTARNNVTNVDFQAMDNMYQESMSTYKVEETEDIKISESQSSETAPVVISS